MAGIEIQEPSDSVKVPDLEVQGARKLGNVIAHLHIVSSRRCDEELCFIRVHHQLVSNHPCLQLLHTTLEFEQCAS